MPTVLEANFPWQQTKPPGGVMFRIRRSTPTPVGARSGDTPAEREWKTCKSGQDNSGLRRQRKWCAISLA